MDHVLHLHWQSSSGVGEAIGQILDVSDQCSRLARRHFGLIKRFRGHHIEARLVGEIRDLNPADALQDDLNVPSRLTFGGHDPNEGADVVEILGAGLVRVWITMRGHDEPAAAGQCMIYRSH